jgi:solute:Na+ symporter, SSS family
MLRWQAIVVFVVLFLLVTVLGFYAARWRRGDLDLLHEWGLAGGRFGTVVTWFLLGGDLYTAYTFIAVPALLFATGATGFFAVPYTIIVYPLVFVVMPRLWSVARRHGYITPADFVRGRYDSQALALAVAVTGILATMPYIALQLIGIQVVIAAMGVTGQGIVADLPLIIAFLILAAYTYQSGLRAPALIAVVKDLLIYITVFVAVIIIPIKLGGFAHIFAAAGQVLPHRTPPATLILSPNAYLAYATLALGSALALFMYPHSITGVLASTSRTAIRRNAALLPAYSLLLALLALLGYMAIAAGVQPKTPNGVVPALFIQEFPEWFAGFGFAAVAIGALVPAAIMSIAASNLFTRNIYCAYLRPDATPREEAATAKLVSLLVKIGALAFIIFLPAQQAINFQLLGGVWILQTFPAIVFGLYTRWLHRRALLIGWAAGMVSGTLMAVALNFKGAVYPLQLGGHIYPAYAAFYALIVNVVIAVVLTLAFNAVGVARGNDETTSVDYDTEVVPAPAAPAGLA